MSCIHKACSHRSCNHGSVQQPTFHCRAISIPLLLLLFTLYGNGSPLFAQENATLGSSAENGSANAEFISASYVGCGGQDAPATDLAFEQRVVELTNIERARLGLPPMKLSADLARSARYHAADMAQDDYFEHDSFDRAGGDLQFVCDTWARIGTFYPSPRAENIAWGYRTPESVVDGWINSPGHYRNIKGDYREIGAGFTDFYWVQNFGNRNDLFPLIINGEAGSTGNNQLTLYAYGDWEDVRLRNDNNAWSDWQSFGNQISWTVYGSAGQHTVTAEMRSGNTIVSSSDTIELIGDFPPPSKPGGASLDEKTFLPMVLR